MIERRQPPFGLDEAKFTTQKIVTYILLLIFTFVVAIVFKDSDQAERSTVIQTVINLVILAVGYWLGSSKTASDNANATMRQTATAEPTAPPPPGVTTNGNTTG